MDLAQDTLLVVDDEPGVLSFCKLALTRGGYQVVEGRSGLEALRVLKDAKSPIRLALLDIVMPGMNGIELAKQIQTTYPQTEILLMSGYSVSEVRKIAGGDHPFRIIWKPFRTDSLLRMVQNVLDGSAHTSAFADLV